MNERIKAIGRQAGFAFIEDSVYGQRWYSSKCGMDASEYEKLVELIVRECIQLNGKELSMAAHSRMLEIYTEHFGVEL